MKILLATTEDFIKRERGTLSADCLAGASAQVTIQNTNGFAVNGYVCVGREGSETAELAQITAVTGQVLTLDLLKIAHKAGEPITVYRYNKRKFYGSTSASGSYSELTGSGSPVLIQVDDPQGTFLEYSGGEGYTYFKATYWNSQTSEESNVADAQGTLGDESARYCTIYAIKKQAGLTNNPYITDGVVETYRKRAENEVNSAIFARYTLPLVNSAGASEIPAIIENCTVLLAAGYMDYQEFGREGEGVKWLGESRAVLKAIAEGRQRLIDSTYLEFAVKATSNQVQGYPDTVDNDNGPSRYFSTKQKW